MTKKEIRDFLQAHPYKEISAAKLEYSLYLMPETEQIANRYAREYLVPSDEDLEKEREILAADNAEELIRLMRKPLSGLNRSRLREKILQYEEEILPFIQRRAITNRQDIFIEHVLYFFLHSQNSYCSWILQNYDAFKSEYLKSMLCLVLGFRGDDSLIPLLMAEAERFERYYPLESFEQAPIFAVQELAIRFMGYSG